MRCILSVVILTLAGSPSIESLSAVATEQPVPPNTAGVASRPPPAKSVKEAKARRAKAAREATRMSADDFAARYPEGPYVETLSYAPLRARHLPAIRKVFELEPAQKRGLGDNGFVVLQDEWTGGYGRLYDRAYHRHLPIVITSDSILHAWHRSYDEILIEFETETAIAALRELLRRQHRALGQRIEAGTVPPSMAAAARDLDLYLTVARRLLDDKKVGGHHPDVAQEAGTLVEDVLALAPKSARVIGERAHTIDFSMFKPRGHYNAKPELQRYFRAMSWVQRIPFRLQNQGQPGQRRALDRQAADAMLLTLAVTDDKALDQWSRLDTLLTAAVGEQDNATLLELDAKMPDWIADLPGYAATKDAAVLARLGKMMAGRERIISAVLGAPRNGPRIDLPTNFYAIGQRFISDSNVLGQVVFDRIPGKRMEPSVFDVQFALGSNRAGALLRGELTTYGYQGRLHELRTAFDALSEDDWSRSVYNGWLAAIRSLNLPERPEALPEAMRTKAWANKTLSTQLASWAELRRDSTLYAKQSFTMVPLCDFPDAYVEPVPEFFGQMVALHDTGLRMAAAVDPKKRERLVEFFTRGKAIMARLQGIAQAELDGTKLSDADMTFLKRIIDSQWKKVEGGCTMRHKLASWDGWYTELYYHPKDAFEFDPVIADVHTTPTDANGSTLGAVLHAATAQPRPMVFTVDHPDDEPCAYVGPVSTYHTVKTRDFKRFADEEWEHSDRPPLEAWQRSFAK